MSWTDDPARCAAAGLPEGLAFVTKPALAVGPIERAVAAGNRPQFVAGDEIYGADRQLRARLEDLGIGYVLAVACSARITIGPAKLRVDDLADALPDHSWQIRSAGAGAKGLRLYQWAYLHLDEPEPDHGQRYLLLRRSLTTGEIAYYRCWTPRPIGLGDLVRVAGMRWSVEESFKPAKDWPAWTSTRSAATPPGSAGPCWSCSPTPT